MPSNNNPDRHFCLKTSHLVTAPIIDSSALEKTTFLVEEKIMPTLADHYAARAREKALQEGLQIGHQEGRQEGLQEGHQEGRQEGLQEGHQEGLQIGRQEVARSLLNGSSGFSVHNL